MSAQHTGYGQQERRQFFRIDDDVYLDYETLDEENYQQRLEQPHELRHDPGDIGLQLQALTAQASNILSQIRKRDPEIGQYLAIVDRKVELLGRALGGSRIGGAPAPNMRANISGGGIAFHTTRPIEPAAKLELTLMLFPNNLLIHALGRVVHCHPDPADSAHPYRIGVEYTRISEMARDALVRHTLELQSARLRQAREQAQQQQ